jgi:hypothetical protein
MDPVRIQVGKNHTGNKNKNMEILWFDELYVLLEGLEASLGS